MGKANSIRVLIVDDHTLLREALATLLSREQDISVVGQAATGVEGVQLTFELRPDVLLLDLILQDADSLHILPAIQEGSRMTRVLVLASRFEEELILRALRLGARGYLLKTAAFADLVRAIRAVSAGEIWADSWTVARLFDEFSHLLKGQHVGRGRSENALTSRESEITRLIGEGLSNKEIGSRLFISEKTVKAHLTSIFRKTKVRGRYELALSTLRNHLSKVTLDR